METPTLNFDVISKILNIRMNQKRTDRIEAHKKIYGPVVKNINNIFEEGSPHNSNDDSPWLQYILECLHNPFD
mgnify:CR=1 FL=1